MFLIILQCGVHLLNSNRHLQTGLSQQDFEVEKLSLGLEKCVSSMCVREREGRDDGFFFSHCGRQQCVAQLFSQTSGCWFVVCTSGL